MLTKVLRFYAKITLYYKPGFMCFLNFMHIFLKMFRLSLCVASLVLPLGFCYCFFLKTQIGSNLNTVTYQLCEKLDGFTCKHSGYEGHSLITENKQCLTSAELKVKLHTYVVQVWGQQIEGADSSRVFTSMVKCRTDGGAGSDAAFPWVSGPWPSATREATTVICPQTNKKKSLWECTGSAKSHKDKDQGGRMTQAPQCQRLQQGTIRSSPERKQQKEKHLAPTHFVVAMTGNVSGWEISVIMFTSSFTVTVGPSVARFQISPTPAPANCPALLKGRLNPHPKKIQLFRTAKEMSLI